MADLSKLRALQETLDTEGDDLNESVSGGGDFAPPAEGAVRLRFISYLELGTHTNEFKGKAKSAAKAQFTFELSGPKHPGRTSEDGTFYPDLITFMESISRNEKANYFKLFKKMASGYEGVKNFPALLGKAFLGRVYHSEYAKRDGSKGVSARLRNEDGYSIGPVTFENPAGELVTVAVNEATQPITWFLWDYPDLENWDELYVDGTWDDGASKNKVQDKIKSSDNWIGSPIYNALIEAGRKEEVAAVKAAPRGAKPAAEQADPLEEAPAKAPAGPAKGKPAAAKGVVAKTPPKAVKQPKEPEPEVDPLDDIPY